MTSLSDKNKSSILTVYITLAFLGSLAALAFLGGIPSDSKNAVIFGFSPLRLAMLAFLAIAALLIGSILFWIFVSRRGMQSAQGFMDRLVTGNTRLGIMWICLLMLVGGIILFLLPQEVLGSRVYIVERLLPILAWAVELSLLTMLLLWLWRREKFTLSLTTEQVAILRTTAIVLGVFLLVGAWILWSRIGLEPDRSGWYSAGTPILFTQVVLAIVIGLVFLRWEGSLADWNSRRRSSTRFLKADTIIFLMLWFTAALIWWLEPMRKWSYFSSEPTPPNFEPYPYSDAGIYDEAAQGLLIGISRNANVMLRPLYSFFLALLHGMIGQDYSLIVLAQVILLAVIPGLVYWIGAKLGSRAAGVVAAVLLLVRERNSIALTNVIEG
ncbi:MAG: hypothetical protein FJZ87_18240, partial [Chloroflexi bacterium]|nr:hypothetical protein [Chloroflexota bacterium]